MMKLRDTLMELLHARLPRTVRTTVEHALLEQATMQQDWDRSLKHLPGPGDVGWELHVQHFWRKEEDRCVVVIGGHMQVFCSGPTSEQI